MPELHQLPTSESSAWPEPTGLGRLVVIGCTTAAVGFFIVVSAGMLANGQTWQTAVGVGLFTSFWGGLGFGGMSGGVVYQTRVDAAAALDAALVRTRPESCDHPLDLTAHRLRSGPPPSLMSRAESTASEAKRTPVAEPETVPTHHGSADEIGPRNAALASTA